MKYSIYNEYGEILRVVECDRPEEQLQAGEQYVAGAADDAIFYVQDGEFVARPPRPHKRCVWRGEWIDTRSPEQIEAEAWRKVRRRRNALLSACDWTQLPDVTIDDKAAWAIYRQQLRDITEQPTFPDVKWPNPPETS